MDDSCIMNDKNNIYSGKLDVTSSFFYDINKSNNIGHKIIGWIHIDGQVEPTYIRNKIQNIVKKYEFLSCIIEQVTCYGILSSNNTSKYWRKVECNIDNHFEIITDNITTEQVIETSLNTSFESNIPGWKIQMLYNKSDNITYIIGNINHNYGDGDIVTKLFGELFDDEDISQSNINCREKNTINNGSNINSKIYIGYLATIIFLFKIIFVILYRVINKIIMNYTNISTENIDGVRHIYKYAHLHTWSLTDIKKIKNHYKVSVNDVMQGIILKSLFLYDNITSCGNLNSKYYCSMSMFNLRDKTRPINNNVTEHNKIGVIVIPNFISSNMSNYKLLADINDITTCYKTTPIVPITTKILQTYYNINQTGAIHKLNKLNSICDFVMSNYATKLCDKTINGQKVIHMSNIVSPHKIPRLYSIISYGDEITMNMSYIKDVGVKDIDTYYKCVKLAYKWFLDGLSI